MKHQKIAHDTSDKCPPDFSGPTTSKRILEPSSDSALPVTSDAPPVTGDSLLDLLDFTQLESSSTIEERFCQVSNTLLHDYRIEVRTETSIELLELLEVEFYLYKSTYHEDPYTHASAEQSQSGRWSV